MRQPGMQASHGSAKGLMPSQPRSLAGRSLHQSFPAIGCRRQQHRAARPQIRATISTEKPPAPQSEGTASGNGKPAGLPVVRDSHKTTSTGKQRVVVLGSGWGACSFVKALSKKESKRYDVTLVSPRNFFLYTPLLPAVATGTVEDRSIVEPVRRIITGKVGSDAEYFEAACTEVDPVKKEVVACFPEDTGMDELCFRVPYDILVLGVGSINNTFGIKGVSEHTFFFKSITDAAKLRRQVSECFERASLPATSVEDMRKLLSFVIVGGGPTGVEVAAELYDMVESDLSKIYPKLAKEAVISVIELQDHVLSTYDRRISEYTRKIFTRNRIQLVLNTKVKSVRRNAVSVVDNSGNERDIEFGACVWATGVAMHPVIKQLQQKLPEGAQTHFRSIITDEFLRVKGSEGSIYAFGDAATIEQPKSLEHADDLFHKADLNQDGKLRLEELRNLLREASKEYSHLEEHSRFLDAKYGQRRFGGLVRSTLQGGQTAAQPKSPVSELTDKTELTREQFEGLLGQIDKGLRALPATAQVAKQQGEFLAHLLNKNEIAAGCQLPPKTQPFKYNHKGSLAYIGTDKAVMDVPSIGPITGFTAGLLWRGFETFSQISFRNMSLVSLDWVRTKIFGRDLSRV